MAQSEAKKEKKEAEVKTVKRVIHFIDPSSFKNAKEAYDFGYTILVDSTISKEGNNIEKESDITNEMIVSSVLEDKWGIHATPDQFANMPKEIKKHFKEAKTVEVPVG